MPKKFIRRHLPDPSRIARTPGLGFLRHHLEDPNLWHLNRRSASGAMFWGLWFAFLPMPLHTIPAVIAALVFRINLPLTVAMVWMVNPLTMLPCFYVAYDIGATLLHRPGLSLGEIELLIQMLEGLGRHHPNHPGALHLSGYLEPFLLGMLVTGFLLGSLGYLGMNWYWRRHVLRSWEKRRKRQAAHSNQPPASHG
ncbi:hypothetical protein EV700_1829 [Fluviicoccus keumensis]|uniref:DUF2062 domain-containing protein n=1 Tax=Fluviicoccus keumensis TaxID=1435465 RepID=A0A4Q7Z3R5_9GAMM|nr:DUF2062 domain-containing protein [Fluviicoccus keumensis]RZU45022.1 hypothetical protein EV700_1829 [Fluviicoccus keumensis]